MSVSMQLSPCIDATRLQTLLELKSFMNPSGKDFMDFWLISVVLP